MKHIRAFSLLALLWSLDSALAEEVNPASKTDRIVTIGFGQKTDIKDWLFPGKVAVFYFSSPFCGPCMRVKPLITKAVEQDKSVSLRILDINRPESNGIDFSSPLAQQYGLFSVPYFIIYDANGKLWKQGPEAFEAMINWLNELGLVK